MLWEIIILEEREFLDLRLFTVDEWW
jgi:hypothetical protein